MMTNRRRNLFSLLSALHKGTDSKQLAKGLAKEFHGRCILMKNRTFFLPVQIEKTEINILQKEWEKKLHDK